METGALLEQHGHRVIPFCAQDDRNEPSRYAEYFPVSVKTTRPGFADIGRFVYSGEARRALERLLSYEQVDLAHLHIYYGKLSASILQPLRQRGVPIVQTLHEYKAVCPVYTQTSAGRPCSACVGGRYWRALPRLCNRGSLPRTALSVVESYVSDALGAVTAVDQFIGISDFVTNRMIAAGIPREKITTVHNFVDVERYEPRYDSEDYVVFFGRLEAVKGIYTVLEAFAGIPDIQLKIAGAGSEAEAVAQWVAERRLNNVELLGFVSGSRLHRLISGAACALVPSEWHEPFGLTALESMALGTPVIATQMGGLPEVVTHEADGLLIPPWDPPALAAAVTDLFARRERGTEMGRAGRAKVTERFNRAGHYAQLRAVYERARGGV